jgi:hypothetical protein
MPLDSALKSLHQVSYNRSLETLRHMIAAGKRQREIIQSMQILETFRNPLFMRCWD